MSIRRIFNILMVPLILVSLFFPENVKGNNETENIVFDVIVPTVLPINVASDGQITVADSIKIINNSNINVRIMDVEINTINDWELIDFNNEPRNLKVNKKQFGFEFMGDRSSQGKFDANIENYPIIGNKYNEINYLELKYDAIVAPQKEDIKEIIAEIIFTINSDDSSYPAYEIVYETNGGTFSEDIKNIYTSQDDPFNLPEPEKEGYIFDGWYETEDFSSEKITILGPGSIGDKVFYAKWVLEVDAGLLTDWNYTINELTDTIILTSYKGNSEQVTVFNRYYVDGIIYENIILGDSKDNTTNNSGPFYDKRGQITSLTIEEGVKFPDDSGLLFNNLTELIVFNAPDVDTSNVTNMEAIFYSCTSLEEVDITNWDTSNVTNFKSAFYNCNLNDLDISGWSFEKLNPNHTGENSAVLYMFSGNDNLTYLQLRDKLAARYATNEDIYMAGLNSLCDVDYFGMSEVAPAHELVKWEYEVDSSTNTITLISYIGSDIDITIYNAYVVDDIQYNTVILGENSRWKLHNPFDNVASTVKTITVKPYVQFSPKSNGLFRNLKALTSIDVKYVDVSNVTEAGSMFWGCEKLTTLDLSGWDTSNFENFNGIFAFCYDLQMIDMTGWSTDGFSENGGSFQNLFNGCWELSEVKGIGDLDVSNVINFADMFCNTKFINLDLSKWDVHPIADLSGMFSYNPYLSVLNIEGWDISRINYASGVLTDMFRGCDDLSYIYVQDVEAYDLLTKTVYGVSQYIPISCKVIYPGQESIPIDELDYTAVDDVANSLN